MRTGFRISCCAAFGLVVTLSLAVDADAAKGLKGVVHAGKARRLPPAARRQLAAQQSVVVEGSEKHFFALYDRNAYQKIPSFVTLDTVLHLFHLRVDDLLAEAERERALPALRDFAQGQARRALELLGKGGKPAEPLRHLATYHAVAATLLAESGAPPIDGGKAAPGLRALVDQHVQRIMAAKGSGATELCPNAMDFTLFKPRGHYTRYRLDRYFRAVTFYAQCGLDLERPEQLRLAVDLARLADPAARAHLDVVLDLIALTAGPADDPGLAQLQEILPPRLEPLPRALSRSMLGAIRGRVAQLPTSRVPAEVGPGARPPRLFRLLGGASTADSLLFSQTADWRAGRPLPSALDLLAALGSADARALLREEAERVPALERALAQPLSLDGDSVYSRWLAILGEVVKQPGADHPDFEQHPAWQRHLTVCAAGSWAELRHDTLLYVKQPLVWAQGGHGAELPAVKAGGYVEPRPEVYRMLVELLELVAQRLPAKDRSRRDVEELEELLTFLIEVSKLELAGAPMPREHDRRLRTIGTELERITLGRGDELPPQALIADVYTFSSPQTGARALEVGIGHVDELWVIVPRGKRRVLMRGGVFSYYEFAAADGERLDDGEWNQKLYQDPPPRPDWARPVPQPRKKRRRGRGD